MRTTAEQRLILGAQRARRLEHAVGGHVEARGSIDRAGNMACHRIHRLDFAAKPLRRAPVDQQQRVTRQACFDAHRIDGRRDVLHDECGGCRLRSFAGDRATSAHPFRETAVEHRDRFVTEPAQHPPQTRGEHAGVLIVDDDLLRGVDADAAEQLCGGLRRGQRVTSVRAVLRAGQILVDMQERRTGYVRLLKFIGAPSLRLHQVVAHVEQRKRRIGQSFGQLVG